jgi:hypothetical protein
MKHRQVSTGWRASAGLGRRRVQHAPLTWVAVAAVGIAVGLGAATDISRADGGSGEDSTAAEVQPTEPAARASSTTPSGVDGPDIPAAATSDEVAAAATPAAPAPSSPSSAVVPPPVAPAPTAPSVDPAAVDAAAVDPAAVDPAQRSSPSWPIRHRLCWALPARRSGSSLSRSPGRACWTRPTTHRSSAGGRPARRPAARAEP